MRFMAFAVLATLLLAGCLQQPSSDRSLPPTNTTPTTAGGGSLGTSPAPTGDPAPTGGMAIRPAHVENTSAGYRLVGDEDRSLFMPPGTVTLSFWAQNEGDNATVLFDPCGAHNPRIVLQDASGAALDPVGPHMRCMAAVGFQPFAHGATVQNNLTWNGTYYDADGTPRTAPDGDYSAEATFVATRDGAQVEVTVTIPFAITDKSGTL